MFSSYKAEESSPRQARHNLQLCRVSIHFLQLQSPAPASLAYFENLRKAQFSEIPTIEDVHYGSSSRVWNQKSLTRSMEDGKQNWY